MLSVPFVYVIIPVLLLFAVTLIIQWLYSQRTHDLEERNKRLSALRKLDEIMLSSSTDIRDVAQKVTDAIVFILGFEIGVLALIDRKRGVLKRVAMSSTVTGVKARRSLPIPYEQLEIPLSTLENLSIRAIKENQMKITHDLYDLFAPALDRTISKEIQDTVKVQTSLVYPIRSKGGVIGVMVVSIARSEKDLSSYERESIENLVDVVGIALENALLYQQIKDASHELALVNQKLQELDQLKDDFVSVASHELRTPMTAIKSYLWMALRRSREPLSENLKKYLTRALISTERLINLVNDMLNVSRIESGRIELTPSPFDMVELCREIMEEVRFRAEEQGLTIMMVEAKMPEVFADVDKIHQVLLNLIGNSLKFTPPGGRVTISFFTDGRVVETSVKDNGVGMAKENLSSLFKKFGRLDNSYVAMGQSGGTGLGLYISKSLIELMHGRISAQSEGLNKGSTFTFSLPVATKEVIEQTKNYSFFPKGEAKGLEPVVI